MENNEAVERAVKTPADVPAMLDAAENQEADAEADKFVLDLWDSLRALGWADPDNITERHVRAVESCVTRNLSPEATAVCISGMCKPSTGTYTLRSFTKNAKVPEGDIFANGGDVDLVNAYKSVVHVLRWSKPDDVDISKNQRRYRVNVDRPTGKDKPSIPIIGMPVNASTYFVAARAVFDCIKHKLWNKDRITVTCKNEMGVVQVFEVFDTATKTKPVLKLVKE